MSVEKMGPSPEEMGLEEKDKLLESEQLEVESTPEEERKYPFDAILVFAHGLQEKGYRLSHESRMRAIAAYEMWKKEVAPIIVLSGSMCEMLMKRFKVPENAIVVSNQFIKTVDEVPQDLKELERRGIPAKEFVTISTGYHLERISDIMNKFGLNSAPISAEEALNDRTRNHADKMKEKLSRKRERLVAQGVPSQKLEDLGLTPAQIERHYLTMRHRYDKVINALKLKDPILVNELRNEPKWQKSMEDWGYWGPLALAVRGDKLKELVEKYQGDITAWLDRHPNLDVTIEDLIEGNFNYRELAEKGRELPE